MKTMVAVESFSRWCLKELKSLATITDTPATRDSGAAFMQNATQRRWVAVDLSA